MNAAGPTRGQTPEKTMTLPITFNAFTDGYHETGHQLHRRMAARVSRSDGDHGQHAF